jgi:hypothetical protein
MSWGVTYADVDMRYVADDVVLGIEDRERRYTFVVHHLESCCERLVATVFSISDIPDTQGAHLLDSHDILGADVQVFDEVWIQLVDVWEALSVLPEELDQAQLRQYTNNISGPLFYH